MTNNYAVRTAGFAAGYLLIFWASVQPFEPYLVLFAPVAAGALWLIAQARFKKRRFDVIALATAGAVGASLDGAGLLAAFVVAAWVVAPALIFVMLMDRWLPGYWLGHGDRFRRSRASVARLAGASALTAAAGLVIQEATSGGTGSVPLILFSARDAVVMTVVVVAVRAVRRSRAPRHDRGLSVVR